MPKPALLHLCLTMVEERMMHKLRHLERCCLCEYTGKQLVGIHRILRLAECLHIHVNIYICLIPCLCLSAHSKYVGMVYYLLFDTTTIRQ